MQTTSRFMADQFDPNISVNWTESRRPGRQVTIHFDQATVHALRQKAAEQGVAYESLINLCLREFAAQGRELPTELLSET
jgi:predicted DNA binding CopG/RHH family protein